MKLYFRNIGVVFDTEELEGHTFPSPYDQEVPGDWEDNELMFKTLSAGEGVSILLYAVKNERFVTSSNEKLFGEQWRPIAVKIDSKLHDEFDEVYLVD